MVPSLTETWVLQVDIPEICDLGSEAFSFPLIDKSVCVCVCVCVEWTEGKIRGKERNLDSGLWWKDSNQVMFCHLGKETQEELEGQWYLVESYPI